MSKGRKRTNKINLDWKSSINIKEDINETGVLETIVQKIEYDNGQ